MGDCPRFLSDVTDEPEGPPSSSPVEASYNTSESLQSSIEYLAY